MTLFDTPAPNNLPPYTIGELSQALKRTVEGAFGLIRVRGEITQPKIASTGHVYLSLKDDVAVLEAVCWKGNAARLSIAPEHGMDVICTGRLTTYPSRSRYQLVIETMELAGEGALLKLLEDRKRRLAAEGLFDDSRKRRIPYIPEIIGVITSPSGAVIHDILHRLADRFPRRVLVWPVAVQGPGAAEQIATALNGFNAAPAELRPDLLIVARGGGSLEDLMPFNEEIVVRAAAASAIPIISAVGHETDHTLIDLVSDRRAPTPTAAAEFAVPVRATLAQSLADLDHRMTSALYQWRQRLTTQVQAVARGLGDPRRLLESARQTHDDRAERLCQAITAWLKALRLHLGKAAAHLKHPRAQLDEARHRLHFLSDRLQRGARAVRDHAHFQLTTLSPRLDPRIMQRLIADWQYTLAQRGRHLDSLSYKNVLARGYVVVRDESGKPVTRGAGLKAGQMVRLEFSDLQKEASVLK